MRDFRGLLKMAGVGKVAFAGTGVSPLYGNMRMMQAPELATDDYGKSGRIELSFPNGLIIDPDRPFTSVHSFMSGVKHSGLQDRITPELIAKHTHIPVEKVNEVMGQMPYDKLDTFTAEQLARLDAPAAEALQAAVKEHVQSRQAETPAAGSEGSQPRQQARQQAKADRQSAVARLAAALKKEQLRSFASRHKVPLMAGGAALLGGGLMALYMALRARNRRRRAASGKETVVPATV